jgi:hypothetical protein
MKSKRDRGTKHCNDFNKTVTFILDVTKETGFPLSYILAYKRCVRYFVRRCGQILDTQWVGAASSAFFDTLSSIIQHRKALGMRLSFPV